MECRIAFVFLLTIFAIGNSQFRRRCIRSPNLWHGHFKEIDYDRGKITFAQIDYDAFSQKIHLIELEKNFHGGLLYEQWVDFVNHTVYVRTFLPNEHCVLYPLPSDDVWRPFGVLPDARFVGTEWLGGIKGGLLVDEFEEERDGGFYHASFAPPVSPISDSETCIPVLESYVKTQGPFRDLKNVHYEFFNVTTSVEIGVFDHCRP